MGVKNRQEGPISLWAPAMKVRQNLSIVAKNENSTEHFVHLHADYLTPWGPKNKVYDNGRWALINVKLHFFKYVDLFSITSKISLSLPEPMYVTADILRFLMILPLLKHVKGHEIFDLLIIFMITAWCEVLP